MIYKFIIIFLLIPIISFSIDKFSGNPILKNYRTADASPQVWNDGKLWVYTSSDYEQATNYSKMDHYKCCLLYTSDAADD